MNNLFVVCQPRRTTTCLLCVAGIQHGEYLRVRCTCHIYERKGLPLLFVVCYCEAHGDEEQSSCVEGQVHGDFDM
jgi:hypothetical protein